MRVRNKNDRRTLRATFNFVRDAVPDDYNSSSLLYSGLTAAPVYIASTRNSSSRNFRYSLGLSGSFNLPNKQFMEASASATASRNHYGYDYSEEAEHVTSATIQQRRGNPSLKVTRLMNTTAVYGIGIGKVNLQASGQYKWAGRLPVSNYYLDKDMFVETYSPYGEWHQIDAGVSAHGCLRTNSTCRFPEAGSTTDIPEKRM